MKGKWKQNCDVCCRWKKKKKSTNDEIHDWLHRFLETPCAKEWKLQLSVLSGSGELESSDLTDTMTFLMKHRLVENLCCVIDELEKDISSSTNHPPSQEQFIHRNHKGVFPSLLHISLSFIITFIRKPPAETDISTGVILSGKVFIQIFSTLIIIDLFNINTSILGSQLIQLIVFIYYLHFGCYIVTFFAVHFFEIVLRKSALIQSSVE